MKVVVRVDPNAATNSFSDTYLSFGGGPAIARLDIEYSRILSRCDQVPLLAVDLLLVAAVAYAVDKLTAREGSEDNWTRSFNITIPVSDAHRWNYAAEALSRCLGFLTGDTWSIDFTSLSETLIRPTRRDSHNTGSCQNFESVCLFSGGLDSLIGAIDWLETNEGNLLLVGHHDRHVPGPKTDQKQLLALISNTYTDRTAGILTRIGMNVPGDEHTYRSRSFLFLALGMQAAASAGPTIPILMPENGNIALNVPLTPSRRGSCSTRTAHPNFLEQLGETLTGVGLTNPIVNPLQPKTKGECVQECLNPGLLAQAYHLSASCAKRGHRKSWLRRYARQCGRCMPCIFRRAALHSVGKDNEIYGADVCTGEVEFNYDGMSGLPGEATNDFRALLSFLRTRPSHDEVARRLLSNGHLPPSYLNEAANIVERAMEEVKNLLRDKATLDIRRQARITD